MVKLTVDFLVTGTLWLGLFVFTVVTNLLPVSGWAGMFFTHVHSAGMVAAFAVFVWLSVNDIIQKHGGANPCLA